MRKYYYIDFDGKIKHGPLQKLCKTGYLSNDYVGPDQGWIPGDRVFKTAPEALEASMKYSDNRHLAWIWDQLTQGPFKI